MQRTWLFVAVLATAVLFPSTASAKPKPAPPPAGVTVVDTSAYTIGEPPSPQVAGDGGGTACRYVEPTISESSWFFDSGYSFGVAVHWCYNGVAVTQCYVSPRISAWGYWRWVNWINWQPVSHSGACGADATGQFLYSRPWSADEYRTPSIHTRGYGNGAHT